MENVLLKKVSISFIPWRWKKPKEERSLGEEGRMASDTRGGGICVRETKRGRTRKMEEGKNETGGGRAKGLGIATESPQKS